ncbi:MAG: DUF1501 domain-containing protein [Hyphomonadaceae bacterium]
MAFGQAQATDKRLLVIILRGGMDGLHAVVPVGDPAYAGLRGRLAIPRSGDAAPLTLDSTFGLHKNLAKMHALYRAGQLLPIHATATAYRERSHFDAQNVLETGAASPFARTEGWLNKALGALPRSRPEMGMALSAQAPLLLRGPTPVATWSPSGLPDVADDTMARLLSLYQSRDMDLANALQSAMSANMVAMESGAGDMGGRYGSRAVVQLGQIAARFLKDDNGPIAAVMEMGNWDTHANQGLDQGVLARNFTALDDGLDAFRTEMGPAWNNTIVLIATEFGRTAAPNGGGGTDHGTGAAAFLAGGAINGGRVLADCRASRKARSIRPRPAPDHRSAWRHQGRAERPSQRVHECARPEAFPDSASVRAQRGWCGWLSVAPARSRGA